MFSDVDESLRDRLIADMPIQGGEVDIAFDRPTREWASRLSKPTLNLFLFDVRERTEFRDPNPRTVLSREGRITTQRPPLRMDLSYVVTAWTKDAADEHRILARALSAMYRSAKMEQETLSGQLVDSEHPLLTRVMPPDHIAKPADLWGVLDNDLHASLTWVVTAPLDVWVPETGPIVRTTELRFADGEETFTRIGGLVHLRGNPDAHQAGVTLAVLGTALRATTTDDGKFAFDGVPAGDYTLRIERPGGPTEERPFTVPSPTYDQEL
jgi:hypothetical protein